MPANVSLSAGDLITIQVIETAQHGAALYSVCRPKTIPWKKTFIDSHSQCVDIELVEPEDMPANLTVTPQNW